MVGYQESSKVNVTLSPGISMLRWLHAITPKVGNDQEMELSYPKTEMEKKKQSGTYTKKTYCKPNGQPWSQWVATEPPKLN